MSSQYSMLKGPNWKNEKVKTATILFTMVT